MPVQRKGSAQCARLALPVNPLAAGIIGAGIGWLLVGKFNAPSMATLSKPFEGVTKSVRSVAESGTQAVRNGAQSASSFVSDGLQSASDSVASLVPDAQAVSSVGHAINSGLSSGAHLGKQYASSLQRTLSENLERQPIILGAIGLAIGYTVDAAGSAAEAMNKLALVHGGVDAAVIDIGLPDRSGDAPCFGKFVRSIRRSLS